MTTPAQPAQSTQSSEEQVQAAFAARQRMQTDPTQQQQQQQQPPVTTPPVTESQAPYANYLAELPESVRPLVEPAFKKWDADVTQRFQALHSEYDPWKEIVEIGDPDVVQGALQVAQVLEQDPGRFLKAFADAYPELVQEALAQPQTPNPQTPPNGSTEQGLGDLDPDNPLVQRLSQLEQMLSQVAGGVNNMTEQQQQQENQKILDDTLAKLHAEHGDFDETYVLSQMAYRGLKPDQAIQEFKNNIVAKYGQPQQQQQVPAPTVMPPGGGLPATPIDVGELDDKATKALVASLLDSANQQNT
jgi:hypothetical protein